MKDSHFRLEPAEGYQEYKVTTVLSDYLNLLLSDSENKNYVEQILSLISNYTSQLNSMQLQNRLDTIREVYKAVDNYFLTDLDENKKNITCSKGCTACCYIDIDVSYNEAAILVDYCKQNKIDIDINYLQEQSNKGRKVFSSISKCIFLQDNLCAVYSVRPVACRKHWVKTEPSLCDISQNEIHSVGKYFNLNIEILASAVLNSSPCNSFQNALLAELKLN